MATFGKYARAPLVKRLGAHEAGMHIFRSHRMYGVPVALPLVPSCVVAAMAGPASVRVWFRLEGAASPDFLDVSSSNNVAQLRKAIYAELKAKLEPRGVIASDLVLSTAEGKTYDEEATVPTAHQTKKDTLIVTGTFVRAARSRSRQRLF